MKTYTKKQLNKIIKKHGKWLRGESGGERADLSYTDLSDTNLSGVNLSKANLYHADLTSANVSNVDLSHAYLSNANLTKAVLSYTDLSNTYLSDANLYDADLSYADLSNARLFCANLSNANLTNTIYENNTIVTFRYKKHTAQYMGLNNIRIGCESYSIQHWVDNFEEIGNRNGYSDGEIKRYGKFIANCAKDFKNKTKV